LADEGSRIKEAETAMGLRLKLAGFLAALSLAGCATVQERPGGGAGPALWEVSDADTRIYLFGTIHMLPQGLKWRTAAVEQALAEADELVFETSIDGDPAAHGQTMVRMGSSPGLPPILERVPPAKRERLRQLIAESRYPPGTFDRLETWAAAFVLSASSLRDLGLSAGSGVEQVLSGIYKARGRPIRALETVEEQFGFFDTLPEHAQRDLLESALENPAEARAQLQQMLDVWSRGDVEGIADTFNAQLEESPELRGALLSRRNSNWARWIDERMDRPGIAFVAVGAGHLAGDDSVQEMLRAHGFEARRLQ
jgi:hypothetical protein